MKQKLLCLCADSLMNNCLVLSAGQLIKVFVAGGLKKGAKKGRRSRSSLNVTICEIV